MSVVRGCHVGFLFSPPLARFMMKVISFAEFVNGGLALANVVFKVTSWEANGYDDSDGDTLYYVADKNYILHSPWTTRGGDYIVPEKDKPFFERSILTYKEGVENGLITHDEVKTALLADIKEGFIGGTASSPTRLAIGGYKNHQVKVNVPCHYKSKDGKVEFDGFVLANMGKYWLLLNGDTNKIIEVKYYGNSLTFAENMNTVIFNKYSEKATVADICRYISSKNSCSSSSYDWVSDDVRSVACPLVNLSITNEMVESFKATKMVGIKKWAERVGASNVDSVAEKTFTKNYGWVANTFVA